MIAQNEACIQLMPSSSFAQPMMVSLLGSAAAIVEELSYPLAWNVAKSTEAEPQVIVALPPGTYSELSAAAVIGEGGKRGGASGGSGARTHCRG